MVISFPQHAEEGVLGDKNDNGLRTEVEESWSMFQWGVVKWVEGCRFQN